jgi:hypothetical protein
MRLHLYRGDIVCLIIVWFNLYYMVIIDGLVLLSSIFGTADTKVDSVSIHESSTPF